MKRFVALGFGLWALGLMSTAFAQISAPPPAELTPLVGSDGVRAGTTARLALGVKLPPGFHTNSNKPRDQFLVPIQLTLDPPVGSSVEEIVFPTPVDLKQEGLDQPLSVFQGEFFLGASVALAATVKPGTLEVPARLRYQACDEKACYAPRTLETSWTIRVVAPGAKVTAQHAEIFSRIAFGHGEKPQAAGAAGSKSEEGAALASAAKPSQPASLDDFETRGTAVGYMRTSEFLGFIHDAESGVKRTGMFEGRGPLAILLIVFIGGLALNLTPCVLPMIPINLAIIGAGTKAQSRGRGFLLGGAYGAAMAIVYGVLGLIVILTAGTFGTINSYWWFNAGIAVLFVVLALAMFDVITIDFSRFSNRVSVSESSRGTFVLAFGMGAVAALLAGACVAPVVVQVVLFSSDLYAKGTSAALALPFVLGIGMAVPWPIAGAGIATLPRPGAWMVRVKQVFGAMILAIAIYYGYEAYSILSNRWVDAADVSASVQEKLKAGWHPLEEGLATAKRDGKPVLIDMWATWCKNCLTMDKTTLEEPDVTAALAGYVKIKFQAEDFDDPNVNRVMKHFDAVGLPTYAILKPK